MRARPHYVVRCVVTRVRGRACGCGVRVSMEEHEGRFDFMTKRRHPTRKVPTTSSRLSWPSVSEVREGPAKKNQAVARSTLQTSAFFQSERKRSAADYDKFRMMPYFGRFAGQCLVFELKRSSSTLICVRVKVESADVHRQLTTLYHTVNNRYISCEEQKASIITGVKDRCIRFAHETVYPPEVESELIEIARRPPPLTFLCERKILLHMGEMNSSNLPYKYSHLNPWMVEYQDVFIHVWSCQLHQDCFMLRMKVKPKILTQELQWMVCNRVPLVSNPVCIELYQADSLGNLSPHNTLPPNQSVLHCIVKPSPTSTHEDNIGDKNFPLVVSVIGHGINQVNVYSAMTLHQFQNEVRSKFSLQPHSFIYFPAISLSLQGRLMSKSAVRMSAIIDGSTLALVDSKKAKLPIINGVPSALVNYEQVPLYQMSILDVGLLNSAPVLAFEVTGPTIPLVFKTIQDQSHKDFVMVSEHPHAISVNPHWTVTTLLKYVECVSGFPCKHLCLRENTFPPDSTLKFHLTCKNWVMHAELVKDLPKVTYM